MHFWEIWTALVAVYSMPTKNSCDCKSKLVFYFWVRNLALYFLARIQDPCTSIYLFFYFFSCIRIQREYYLRLWESYLSIQYPTVDLLIFVSFVKKIYDQRSYTRIHPSRSVFRWFLYTSSCIRVCMRNAFA